jgi:uncharacterized membrane protein
MVDEGKPNPSVKAIALTMPTRLFAPLGLAAIDQRHVLSVVLLGVFLLLLMGAQVVAKGQTNLFLLWNLFLAGLPIIAAWAARRATKTWWFVLVSLAWLGFFPNAPYIVTDIMHVRNSHPSYLWLDVIVYGTAAATGFYAGLVSLRWMHEAIVARVAPLWGWAFVGATSIAAGFGVYLGRFQRWNTWDILTRPGDVLAGAWGSLGEVRVLAFALLFALGILVGYTIMTLLLGAPRLERPTTSGA